MTKNLKARSRFLNTGSVLGLAIGGALVTSAMPAAAQSQYNDAYDTIVVTGTARPVDANKIGNSLTIIDGVQLEDAGITYISDALRQVPGVAVSRTGPFGGITQVRVRGSESNHVLILVDGVDVSAAGSGETDLSTLLAGDVQKIESLRGPQSGLYGSNALAGVINIITQRDVEGWFFNGAAEAGSFDTKQMSVSGGIGDGKSSLSGSAVILDTEGFDSSPGGAFNGPAYLDGDKEGNEVESYMLRGVWAASDAVTLDGFIRHVNKSSELDGFDFSGVPGRQGLTFDDASFADTENTNYGARAVLGLMDGAWITTISANSTDSTTDGGTYGSKSGRVTYAANSSYQWGNEAFKNTLTGFVEAQEETYRNTMPFDASQAAKLKRDLFGFGAEYRAEINEQFFLSGVVRRDNNDKFDDATTYSIAGAYLHPTSGTRVHASFGSGVTNPTFFEQFGFVPGTFVGNPDLQPEKSRGGDIGVEQTFLGGSLVVDATYFVSSLEDEISSAFPSVINNVGESDRKGVELSLRFSPTDTVDIIGSYTHLDATDPDGSAEVRRPDNQASLDVNWRLLNDKAQFTFGATHNGAMLDNDYTSGFTPRKVSLDSYTLFRAQGTYKFSDSVEVYLRSENIFDAEYSELANYLTPGRSVYGGIRVAFGGK